ncbi:MAG: hypothetical protein ACI85O_003650, partial [Saprospiraceae bacterium]
VKSLKCAFLMLFCFFCSDKRRGKKSKSERET